MYFRSHTWIEQGPRRRRGVSGILDHVAGAGTSSACDENFWSAACWFGPARAQSMGFENPSGTITVTPPPVSRCAGTIQADGSCLALPSVNDPSGTAGQLDPGNIQTDWADWAARTSASANVPQGNTAGTGWIWIGLGLAAGAAVLFGRR